MLIFFSAAGCLENRIYSWKYNSTCFFVTDTWSSFRSPLRCQDFTGNTLLTVATGCFLEDSDIEMECSGLNVI